MARRPNIRTIQMEDLIRRLIESNKAMEAASRFAVSEIRAWMGNWGADSMDRMKKDFIKSAESLESALSTHERLFAAFKNPPERSLTRDRPQGQGAKR